MKKMVVWLLIACMIFVPHSEVIASALTEEVKESSETVVEAETEEVVIEEVPEQDEIDQELPEEPELEIEEDKIEEVPEVDNEEEQEQALAKQGWQKENDIWYYYKTGVKATGWLVLSNDVYYLKEDGSMVTGWYDIGGKRFYFFTADDAGTEGKMATGWLTIGKYRYYFQKSGATGTLGRTVTGWLKQGGRIYYLKKTGDNGVMGRALTGWQSIGGKHYYFKKSGSTKGSMFTGVLNVSGNRYYFKKTGTYGVRGEVQTGWQTVDSKTYYFNPEGEKGVRGRAVTGWQEIGDKKFYFMKSSKHLGKMLTGWQSIGGVKYYFKKTGDPGIKGCMFKGWQTIGGKRYYFGSDGKLRTNTTINGIKVGADGSVVTNKTLKSLLQTGLQPIGQTLYVLGGGHGAYTTQYGVNSAWKPFFNKQTSAYEQTWSSVTDRSKGLDCSGYVGWTVYNTMNTKSGGSGCSAVSYQTPALYKNKGWGSYSTAYKSGDFKVGDVVAWKSGNTGHVWIVLGKCSDGSYVVLHSTPASGPQLTGTMTKSGKVDSKAAKLAKQYMDKYYPELVKKMSTFPSIGAQEYVYGPGGAGLYRFSWDLTGTKALSDPDGYSKMSAEEILADLF